MKLDHSQPVLTFDGRPMVDPDGQPATFRALAVTALLNGTPTELGAEKMARGFALAQKFYGRGCTISLTVDEAALLKERAGASLNVMAYGRLVGWLEGEPQIVADDGEPDEEETS